MTQALYTHMNNKRKKTILKDFPTLGTKCLDVWWRGNGKTGHKGIIQEVKSVLLGQNHVSCKSRMKNSIS
jgi:hypothetical protein